MNNFMTNFFGNKTQTCPVFTEEKNRKLKSPTFKLTIFSAENICRKNNQTKMLYYLWNWQTILWRNHTNSSQLLQETKKEEILILEGFHYLDTHNWQWNDKEKMKDQYSVWTENSEQNPII